MKKETIYAVAVVRVSTQKQEVFGDSLDDQIRQIELTRERTQNQLDCEIVIKKTFELAESASVAYDFQPLQKVIEYCKKENCIRFAFIKSIDRYTRAGAVVYGELKAEFAKLGVTPIDTLGVINNTQVNTLSHLGVEYPWSVYCPTYITELLEAERAKGEVRDSQTRMIGAAIRYTRMGYWRGSIPLGFITERVDTPEGRRLVLKPHPEESLWFIKMFELKAEGIKSEQEIVNQVNAMGFVTKKLVFRSKEKPSGVIAIKGKRKLTVKMLRYYIQNPLYAGVNTERSKKSIKHKWLNNQAVYLKRGGLLSVDLWNKANWGKRTIIDEGGVPKIIKGASPDWQQKKLKLNPDFPYKQYILCPFCAHPLKASYSRSKSGKRHPYYHCSFGHKYWGIKSGDLETAIIKFVEKIKFSKRFVSNFESNFMKNWNLRMEQLNRDNINWEKMILGLREKQSATEERLKLATTPTGFQIIENEIENIKRQIVQATVERSKNEDEEIDIQVLINSAKYWMEHFSELVLNTPDSLKKARLFGLIFEKLPTYKELENGTPKLRRLYELNQSYTTGSNTLSGLTISNVEHLSDDLVEIYKTLLSYDLLPKYSHNLNQPVC